MDFETFKLRQDDGVLTVTLENPPINLMSGKMVAELFQLSGSLAQNSQVRVVVIDSSNPDFFIAHFDLRDLAGAANDTSNPTPNPNINSLQSLGLSWQTLPQVKIAKIDGRCRGGGFEFVLALDMCFASERSLFCFPEGSSGFLAAGGGATRTVLTAGPPRALEVLLSARDFSAAEAERYGLINRSLHAAELDGYVAGLASRVARRSPAVISMHRKVVECARAPFSRTLVEGFAAENEGLRAGLAGTEMLRIVELLLAAGQSRENELDLPATLASMAARG